MKAATEVSLESLVHHFIVAGLLETGRAPSLPQLATRAGKSPAEIETALRSLDATHGLVLHPHRCEPWVVHPFSTSPTPTWVSAGKRGWWAPCLWCGLGISALHGGAVTIHTRLGAEAEPIEISARGGVPGETELWVHFPEPPRFAWNNVHHFCARLVAFRAPGDAAKWTDRHGFTLGEVLPIAQLGDLARRWYRRHADRDWSKWTVAEARQIFTDAGLTGRFWELPEVDRKF